MVFAVVVALVLAVAAVCATAPSALAQTIQKQWTVEFTGTEMKDDGSAQIAQVVNGLQPGDSAEFDITLFESYDGPADWYMRNEVLATMEKTFQDANASGGSYSYNLVYTGPQGERKVILSNDTVSGDAGTGTTNGLFDATTATDEWFFLDTLASQASGQVVLTVAIDGETHGNSYFDTNARVQLAFAAEPNGTTPGTPGTNLVTEEDPEDPDEPDEPDTPTTTNTPTTTKKTDKSLTQTGDNLRIGMLVVVIVVAVVVLVVMLIKRRRDNEADAKADNYRKMKDEEGRN